MPPLQFQPLSSQPTPSFWSALTSHKLDKLKLDDAQQTITAWLEEGREVVDREAASSSGGGGGTVGVDGVLGIGANAFGEEGERWAGGDLLE
jgi:ubiquitin-like modifier-activating enzyme ATG7